MNGERRAEGVWPAPNPRAGKPVPRGMGFPAHVGAEDGSRTLAPVEDKKMKWKKPHATSRDDSLGSTSVLLVCP